MSILNVPVDIQYLVKIEETMALRSPLMFSQLL